jgi:LTXXQ motif family protein
MWKAALAGAIALATLGSLSISSNGVGVTTAAAQDVVITESHIARLKRSLRLTPTQMVHWHRVEAALRSYLTRAASTENSEGSYYQRARARIAGYALNAAAMQRVSSAAGPLIATLDEEQKRDGMQAIRAMGLASMF